MFLLVLLQGVAAQALDLRDADAVDMFVYAQRDAFEKAGLWGESYDPTIWRDRRRQLADIGPSNAIVCPDGTTSCQSNQICLNCQCTIFARSEYIGGKLVLANNACIWSKCSCGVAR